MELNHPQPPTQVQVDNSTDVGIANKSIRQNIYKTMDMRFHWNQDKILQTHFNVFWKPGPTNLGDYYYKHHPEAHHIQVRITNLHEPKISHCALQGCANSHNCYTTVTRVGLYQGLHTNWQHHGIN